MKKARIAFSSVRELVEACGGLSVLGAHLGVSPQAVFHWVDKDHLPARRVRDVQAVLVDIGPVRIDGSEVAGLEVDLWPLVKPAPTTGRKERPGERACCLEREAA
jgi:hypothetical protein